MEALGKLGIDGWGILLYLVNFGILMWVLHRYVFVPLSRFLEERREQIKENIEAAEVLKQELQTSKAAHEAEARRKDADMHARFEEAKKVVKEQAAALLADAEERREGILSQANEQAASVKDRAMSQAEEETKKRIERVVMHVLKENVSKDVIKKSVSDSWEAIASK